jgi:hypothetical protein
MRWHTRASETQVDNNINDAAPQDHCDGKLPDLYNSVMIYYQTYVLLNPRYRRSVTRRTFQLLVKPLPVCCKARKVSMTRR